MERHHRLTVPLAVAALAATAGADRAVAQAVPVPSVASSPALGPDPVREAAWAAFFGGLPHGDEIASLRVLLGTAGDVAARCASGADGCYLRSAHEIVMPGGALPGSGIADEIARHEYGHHIAAESDNAPFARGLGTRRWFTHEHICQRMRSGELVADAGEDYARSVGEGFAESYRVASGGARHAWIVDVALFPDAGAKRAVLADVRRPWTEPRLRTFSGRARRGARITARLSAPLDGTVAISATGLRRLWLADARGRRVAHAHRRAGRLVLHWVDCGQRRLGIEADGPDRGGGRYRLTVATA